MINVFEKMIVNIDNPGHAKRRAPGGVSTGIDDYALSPDIANEFIFWIYPQPCLIGVL